MRTILILLLFLATLTDVSAQEMSGPMTGKAVYFDVSPPLRERPAIRPGKSDRSWKEGVVPNRADPAGTALRAGVRDSVVQYRQGQTVPDSLILGFAGLGNLNQVVPPDPMGAAGPNHYLQIVNESFAIWNKSGALVAGPFNSSFIWEGMPNNSNNGDGIALFDEQANRWLISQISLPNFPAGPFFLMMAVSQSPDPAGAWYRYEFEFTELPDYPKLGVWPDGCYLSFTRVKATSLQYLGATVMSFNRTAMLAGDPDAPFIRFQLQSPLNLLPADCDGPFPPAGTPCYFGYTESSSFVVREFVSNWANPSASSFGAPFRLPVSPFSGCSNGISQKGSDKRLATMDTRLMYRLQFRQFPGYCSMVTNQTVGVESHAGIRWYELQKTNGDWFVSQQSTYAPDSLSRWMGSIAMDSAGNIALGYSVSSASLFPSIRFTGRMKHDPPGQMTLQETSLVEGTGSQTGLWNGESRWGDYSSMTVDPSSASTFWYTQEYYSAISWNDWKTNISCFSFRNILDFDAVSSPSSVCTGGFATLGVDIFNDPGNCTYSWSSRPAGFSSTEKNPVITPGRSSTYIVQVTSGAQVKTDSVFVMVIPAPTVAAGNDTTVCRYVGEVAISGSVTNAATTSWTTSGDGYFSDPAALNTAYQPGVNDQATGSFSLKLTAFPSNACQPVSSLRQVVIDTCLGITEVPPVTLSVQLYPVPAEKMLTVRLNVPDGEGPVTLSVMNMLDITLFYETLKPRHRMIDRQVDVSRFPKGLYVIVVRSSAGSVAKPFLVK